MSAQNAKAQHETAEGTAECDHREAERSLAWMGWLLFVYQIIVLGFLMNPWFSELRIGGWVLLAIEGVLLLCWALPVFLYQLMWKGRSVKESIRIALWSFVDAIGLAVV